MIVQIFTNQNGQKRVRFGNHQTASVPLSKKDFPIMSARKCGFFFLEDGPEYRELLYHRMNKRQSKILRCAVDEGGLIPHLPAKHALRR